MSPCNSKSGVYREYFFFQAEDGIRDVAVTGVQTCALPIYQGDRCESVRLPGQFLQFQPLIRDCQNQRESRPNRSEPAVRVFVPRQKREEPGRRKGVKESYHALVMLGGRGLAREKIQSSGGKRNRQDTQRHEAQNLCA